MCQANHLPEFPRLNDHLPDFSGYSFAFFGRFSIWPSYHPEPQRLVKRLGGEIRKEVTDVTDELDFLVLGDVRGKGRAAAKKKAESLRRQAGKKAAKTGEIPKTVTILTEHDLRSLVRVDVTGRVFTFFGDFEYCPKGFDAGRPPALTEAAGGVVHDKVDETVNYLVLGNRRGKGKTAAQRDAQQLIKDGHHIQILDEDQFLELVRTEKTDSEDLDFPSFLAQLHGVVDAKKVTRALKMLKADSFKLYVDVDEDHLVGVVRSQTGAGTVYSPWLNAQGQYGCSDPGLSACWGQQGGPCKHLLVLLLGLVQNGEIDPGEAYKWIESTRGRRNKQNEDLAADTFLRYKSAEAGELDWRPMETVPEDYYAF